MATGRWANFISAEARAALSKEQIMLAKLARLAKGDCMWGGAKAIVVAKRIDRLRKRGHDAEDVVSYVYTRYTGHSGSATAYDIINCHECGNPCIGQEAADKCCEDAFNDWEFEDEES